MDFGKWLLESDSLVIKDDFIQMFHVEAITQCFQIQAALPRRWCQSGGVVFFDRLCLFQLLKSVRFRTSINNGKKCIS